VSGNKTPFDALVRLRRHEEDEARARTVAARRAAEAARAELERRRRSLEQGLPERSTRAELWHALDLVRSRGHAEVADAEGALFDARAQVTKAAAAGQEAARKRHVAEMLADKARAEQAELESRRERRALDEVALRRGSNPGRGGPGAARRQEADAAPSDPPRGVNQMADRHRSDDQA
jgi:flagellar protein FliJ